MLMNDPKNAPPQCIRLLDSVTNHCGDHFKAGETLELLMSTGQYARPGATIGDPGISNLKEVRHEIVNNQTVEPLVMTTLYPSDAQTTRSFTEQGIAAAIARVKAGEDIAVGVKVCSTDGDVIGVLVSKDGGFGQVRYDPDPKAQTVKVKMNEIFDAELAAKLSQAYYAIDQQAT